jgi:hypothetical protein
MGDFDCSPEERLSALPEANAAIRPRLAVPPALAAARGRTQYIACPACATDAARYLFYRAGVRFVMCRACGLVYANPVPAEAIADFDASASPDRTSPVDVESAARNFGTIIGKVATAYERLNGHPPHSILVVGRWNAEFSGQAGSLSVTVAAGHDDVKRLGSGPERFDVVFLNGLVEQVPDPEKTLGALAPLLSAETLLAVDFSNMSSFPSRVLRRRWKRFFDNYVAYYNAENLGVLMWRMGLARAGAVRLRWRYSLGYLARRLELNPRIGQLLERSGIALDVASGREVALFRVTQQTPAEKLSIIVPVYNEAGYVGEMLTALLALELPIEHEVIAVESNSTDGSREIVRTFESHPLLRVIYQDTARGKGIAVRDGLKQATGTIMLIQDADFEYDLDDYDALLEPILERRASFVLGSRNLGLDDWRIRRFQSDRGRGLALNVAHLAFARTFNLLYQQRTTDINTMFKVFRRECIEGVEFQGDRFNFDIELVCKIVRMGYAPFEVPVNYNSRGFDEGKKITLGDAWPSYYQLFRCRFE